MSQNPTLSRQQEMFNHIEAWQQSGKTQKAYCTEHEVHAWQFQYWLRKYRKTQQTEAGFIPVRAFGKPIGDIRIHYPNGVELHLAAPCDPKTLRLLISLA